MKTALPTPASQILKEQNRLGLMLSLPAILLMAVMLVIPLIAVFAMSFTDWSIGNKSFSFVGLEHYTAIFQDKLFWKAAGNTAAYVLIVVPISLFGGLGIALLINSMSRWQSFWRTVYFLPVMATLVAMAIVWEFMLSARLGIVSQLLQLMGFEARNWLQETGSALYVLAAIGIWQSIGFNMVLFLAGLSGVPKDLRLAAEMDGAMSAWERFRLVIWPLLTPVTMFVTVISAIRAFQVFDTVHVLTRGGPNNASIVMVYQIYEEGFVFFRTSYAAALTVIFILVLFALVWAKSRFLDKRVHY